MNQGRKTAIFSSANFRTLQHFQVSLPIVFDFPRFSMDVRELLYEVEGMMLAALTGTIGGTTWKLRLSY